jgi:disulfide bond formation protein DsbB
MSRRVVLGGLAAASLGALTLAFWVQYGLGYPPCSLCLQARLPHYALIVLGGLALRFDRPAAGLVAAMALLLVAFTISLTHVGVEAGRLPLPEGCVARPTGPGLEELRASLMQQTRPSCAQSGPAVLGLTMAAWHALTALALALAAALALSPPRRER